MKNITTAIVLTALLGVGGCANELSQRKLVETQAALEAAQNSEGAANPEVALYVKYANDELERARELLDDGKEEAAQRMLDRARADAELALTLADNTRTRMEAQDAWNQVQILQKETNGVTQDQGEQTVFDDESELGNPHEDDLGWE